MTDQQIQVKKAIGVPPEGGCLSPRARKGGPGDYKIDPDTGCWEWQKGKHRGYGVGSFKGAGIDTNHAHRAYYIAANGPLPPGMEWVVDHLCRNPGCVNPKHLEAVRSQTNIHRGRQAVINMEVAREVRRRVRAGQSSHQIRDELGVSVQNVWWIAEDRAWREDPKAPRQPVWPERDCRQCGAKIEPHRGRKAVYCSTACRTKYNVRLKAERTALRRAA